MLVTKVVDLSSAAGALEAGDVIQTVDGKVDNPYLLLCFTMTGTGYNTNS